MPEVVVSVLNEVGRRGKYTETGYYPQDRRDQKVRE